MQFKKTKRRFIAIVAMFIVLIAATGSYASAASPPSTETDEEHIDMFGEHWQPVADMYRVFANISIPLGVVSFAAGAVKLLTSGEEREQAKGKAQMKYTLMVVAGIQVLPLVLSAAYNLTRGFRWDPFNPTGIR